MSVISKLCIFEIVSLVGGVNLRLQNFILIELLEIGKNYSNSSLKNVFF